MHKFYNHFLTSSLTRGVTYKRYWKLSDKFIIDFLALFFKAQHILTVSIYFFDIIVKFKASLYIFRNRNNFQSYIVCITYTLHIHMIITYK